MRDASQRGTPIAPTCEHFTSLFNDFTTTAVTEPFHCYLTVAGRPRTYSEGAAAGLAGTTRRCVSATEVPKDARGRAAAVALQIVRARPMVSRAGSKGVRPAGSHIVHGAHHLDSKCFVDGRRDAQGMVCRERGGCPAVPKMGMMDRIVEVGHGTEGNERYQSW